MRQKNWKQYENISSIRLRLTVIMRRNNGMISEKDTFGQGQVRHAHCTMRKRGKERYAH